MNPRINARWILISMLSFVALPKETQAALPRKLLNAQSRAAKAARQKVPDPLPPGMMYAAAPPGVKEAPITFGSPVLKMGFVNRVVPHVQTELVPFVQRGSMGGYNAQGSMGGYSAQGGMGGYNPQGVMGGYNPQGAMGGNLQGISRNFGSGLGNSLSDYQGNYQGSAESLMQWMQAGRKLLRTD
ncbi:hypothetical protein CYMTET_20297 [Cymbomonas tetramitiformis]|uniref:Uncharacterized protein n=1 Tax=Cymbomonas tetramitiformis TaxID=36881 RepID=A0AAE0G4C7_9CHLO|nr:hypothetical protein CYMTET_20297 [Cymbomonas tetramitiformis]